jgi:DNA-binding NtrC family response regulator
VWPELSARPNESPQPDAVLAIDDDPGVLDIIRMALQREGYTLHCATSARAGIELYREHWQNIRLVILDFTLPEMNGSAVFQALHRINPKVRALLLTGTYELGQNTRFEAGLVGCLQKPFAMKGLVKRVHQEVQADLAEKQKSMGLAPPRAGRSA